VLAGKRALAADSTAPGGKSIGVAFLGASYSHAIDKLKVILASKDYHLIGIAEDSQTARKNCENLGAKLITREEALERSELIIVESAIRDHGRDGLAALRAGKHVHVEKPPAMTLGDMQEMVALAGEKKRVLQTGYMWRYHPGFTAIFEATRKGWLGDIFLVRAYISNFLAAQRRPEWGEFQGGSMFELGSHLIDASVRLLGKPKSVTPFLHHHGRLNDSLNDNNLAVLEYDRAVAVIMNSALQTTSIPQRSFEVIGSNGSATLSPLEPPRLELDMVTAAGPYKKGPQTISLPAYKRFEADLEELAAAVRGERALSSTLDEELVVQETLVKACRMV
jgi:predicted dehydrogenase